MKSLLDGGLCIDHQNQYEETPLGTAVYAEQTIIVALLLPRGANFNITNRWGYAYLRVS